MNSAIGRRPALGLVALLFATVIWGTTFPTMKLIGESLSALEIMVARYGLAAVLLIPVLIGARRHEWRWGMLLGACMVGGVLLQLHGLMLTSSNRNAFLTGMNVLLVPLLGRFIGLTVSPVLWIACGLAALGMAGLFWQNDPWNLGDTLSLLGAAMFALHVLVLGRLFSHPPAQGMPRALQLTAIQMATLFVAATLLLLGQGLWSGQGLDILWNSLSQAPSAVWWGLAYLAAIASIGGITLQVWGQRHVGPVPAAIVYGNEPVFAALAAWVLIGEVLSGWALPGAALVVLALVISQWPSRLPK